MSDRDKFQGLCLENSEGYLYMGTYDDFPPDVRLRLQSSAFNLCAACVVKLACMYHNTLLAIERMEAKLREAQPPGYPSPTVT